MLKEEFLCSQEELALWLPSPSLVTSKKKYISKLGVIYITLTGFDTRN
jgi:hypothetical protein